MPRTDTAARVVAADLERTFAALVDPNALSTWLPPDGMTGRFERFDLRAGGGYRMVLEYDDAAGARGKTSAGEDVAEARFVEVSPGDRVVQEIDFVTDDPAFTGTMRMTWSVASVAGGTRVEIRAEHVPAGISAAEHAVGLASSLANLAAFLERPTE